MLALMSRRRGTRRKRRVPHDTRLSKEGVWGGRWIGGRSCCPLGFTRLGADSAQGRLAQLKALHPAREATAADSPPVSTLPPHSPFRLPAPPPRLPAMQWRLCLPFLPGLLSLAAAWSLPFPLTFGSDAAREIPTSHRLAWQTARVAVHFLNYRASSPSNLLILGEVKRAKVQDLLGNRHKYEIQFTTDDFKTGQKVGSCSATVTFEYKEPRPFVEVNCSSNKSRKGVQENDYSLYKTMKKQKMPITTSDIPDSNGYVDPSEEPLQDLAMAGSSFLMWEKSAENLHYTMAQIKRVKQWMTKDGFLDFDYNILLNEIPTQAIVPCHMRIVWFPSQHMKVKYHCDHVPRPEESEEDSSGAQSEDGSAFYGNF